MKIQSSKWEKIFTNDITHEGLISKINSPHTQYLKKNTWLKKWAKDLNRHFAKKDIWIINRHIKRWSTSPIIREIQIKTIMRYHFPLVRMSIIGKTTNNEWWRRNREKGNLYTVGRNVIGVSTMKNSVEVLQNTKNKTGI